MPTNPAMMSGSELDELEAGVMAGVHNPDIAKRWNLGLSTDEVLRLIHQARAALQLPDELLRLRGERERAIKQLESIVCTEGCDRGVVLVSHESPTHYDPEEKCQVYDHENFSPLGDALIALHDTLKGSPDGKSKDRHE